MLIYDKYLDSYYEVIPVKKIEEYIEERRNRLKYIDKEINKESKLLKNLGSETDIDRTQEYICNLEEEREIITLEIRPLEQLIKENCKEE